MHGYPSESEMCSNHNGMDNNQLAIPGKHENVHVLQALSKIRNFFQSDLNKYIVDVDDTCDNGFGDIFNGFLGAFKEEKELIINCRHIKRICSQPNATESENSPAAIKSDEAHVNSIERCADISSEEATNVSDDTDCLSTVPNDCNEHELKLSDDQDLDDNDDLLSLHPSSLEYEYLKNHDVAPCNDDSSENVPFIKIRNNNRMLNVRSHVDYDAPKEDFPRVCFNQLINNICTKPECRYSHEFPKIEHMKRILKKLSFEVLYKFARSDNLLSRYADCFAETFSMNYKVKRLINLTVDILKSPNIPKHITHSVVNTVLRHINEKKTDLMQYKELLLTEISTEKPMCVVLLDKLLDHNSLDTLTGVCVSITDFATKHLNKINILIAEKLINKICSMTFYSPLANSTIDVIRRTSTTIFDYPVMARFEEFIKSNEYVHNKYIQLLKENDQSSKIINHSLNTRSAVNSHDQVIEDVMVMTWPISTTSESNTQILPSTSRPYERNDNRCLLAIDTHQTEILSQISTSSKSRTPNLPGTSGAYEHNDNRFLHATDTRHQSDRLSPKSTSRESSTQDLPDTSGAYEHNDNRFLQATDTRHHTEMLSPIFTSGEPSTQDLPDTSGAYEHDGNRFLHPIDTRHETEMMSQISKSGKSSTQDLPDTSGAYEHNNNRFLHPIDTRHETEMMSQISTSGEPSTQDLTGTSGAYEHNDNRFLQATDTRHRSEMLSPISTSSESSTQDLPDTSGAYEHNDNRFLHEVDIRHHTEIILPSKPKSGGSNTQNVSCINRRRKNNDSKFVVQINTRHEDTARKKYHARDKMVCIYYLTECCNKSDCKFSHTFPNKDDMTLLLKQIDEGKLLKMINNENLVIKYGQCFATVFYERLLTKLLLMLAVKCLKLTEIQTDVLEITLRHLNNLELHDIDCKDLLNQEIRHKQVCLILLEEILHNETFSAFTKAFLFLIDFMKGNNAAFSYNIAENVLKKVCSSNDRSLAIAFNKILEVTNPKIMNHPLIPRFKILLQTDKDDLKENSTPNTEMDNYNARGDQANNEEVIVTNVDRGTTSQHAANNKAQRNAAKKQKRISASTSEGAQGPSESESKSRPMLSSHKPYDPNFVDVKALKKKKKEAKIRPCHWATAVDSKKKPTTSTKYNKNN